MSDWISVKDRKPIKQESPILAVDSLDYFCTKALHYIEDGWDGPGWYDSSQEYGMSLNEEEVHFQEYRGMLYWMPLPNPPTK